jgi:hypothetical protein
MAKKNNHIAPWVLFIAAAGLLAAGWWMKPFPVLIVFGFAPLFALVDQVQNNDHFWTHVEFILLALVVAIFAAHHFDPNNLVAAMVQAIVFALAFLAYNFSHQQLGDRLGKFTIIFFWLALEYLMLKLPWRNNVVFLAEVMDLKPTWTQWTYYTGYLGISLWILLSGLFFYLGALRSGINWYWLGAGLLLLVGPVVYSLNVNQSTINHSQMITLYETGQTSSVRYGKEGELVSRTAAWISIVILLLALVKTKTKKK